MTVTTRQSWKTFVIYKNQTENAKHAQINNYDALRGRKTKIEFQRLLTNLANLAGSLIPLVYKRSASAVTIAEITYTLVSMLSPSDKRTHADGIFNGYYMYDEMKTYMERYGYDALQVVAYNMDYTTPQGSYSLLFGNNSGTQLGNSFRVTGVMKNGKWLYS